MTQYLWYKIMCTDQQVESHGMMRNDDQDDHEMTKDKALQSEAYPWTVTGETMYLNDVKSKLRPSSTTV